jgi:EAL domain-containing protein (putative c-di-GMP-specific phosphodiesterase class I)/CheY-like chemotaxis protein
MELSTAQPTAFQTDTAVQPYRVVIVDDEPNILRAYKRSLTCRTISVLQASSVDEALGLVRAGGIDAVVSDIAMPGQNGIDLLRTVHGMDLDLPVILLTGHPCLESAEKAVEYGAMRYLHKPIDVRVLRESVESAARAYRTACAERRSAVQSGMAVLTRGRAAMEVSLDRALATLHMAYQPIVDAASRSRKGYEALVRSKEPTLPHPGALFAAAERLGRVLEIGRAVRSAVAARMPLLAATDVVFVNLHPEDLADPELYRADAPLSQWARRIVLEITERTALDHIDEVASKLAELRRMGYKIAVDDLGAGYAALSSLAELEPEVVKLDMSLIRGIGSDTVKQRLVGCLVSVCRDLDIAVVAEGIETESERDTVVGLGAGLLQGYRLGRPSIEPAEPVW